MQPAEGDDLVCVVAVTGAGFFTEGASYPVINTSLFDGTQYLTVVDNDGIAVPVAPPLFSMKLDDKFEVRKSEVAAPVADDPTPFGELPTDERMAILIQAVQGDML